MKSKAKVALAISLVCLILAGVGGYVWVSSAGSGSGAAGSVSEAKTQNVAGEKLADGDAFGVTGSAADPATGSSVTPTEAPKPTEQPEPTETPEDDKLVFTFTASGDNLIHSCLYEQAAARGRKKGRAYDFSYCYKDVQCFFGEQDLNWINQETLVNSGYSPSGYPTFSTPVQVVKDLRNIGFTIYNTSSNHSYDKLAGGLSAAMSFWNKMKQRKEGREAFQVGIVKRSRPLPQLIRKINGVKVGFLSYTYGTNGISIDPGSTYRVVYLSERDRIRAQVKALRKKVDVVMVSCHWGVENSHTVSAEQKSLASDLVSWGADLIIGTHPHVLQNCAWIKAGGRKGFCAYSLGNFISGQVETDQILGGTLTCTIQYNKKNKKVRIIEPMLKPSVTIYGPNRSNIHVKWLEDYTDADASVQSSHISKGTFISLAKRVVSERFLDI